MKTRYFYLLLLALITSKFLLATELKLELENVQNLALENEPTPQPTVFTGVPFQLKATVINGDRNTGNVIVNGLENNNIRVEGRSHHTNIVMDGSRFKSTITYIFQTIANQEGVFQIGPAHVKQGNETIQSNTVQIRVVEQPKDMSKIKTATGEQLTNLTQENEITCELLTDKKNVFQGEPFVVTVKITIHKQISNLGLDLLSFPGFTSKELGQPQQRQELKDDKVIEIVEKRFALIPMQTGSLTINPAKVIYQVPIKQKHKPRGIFGDDFFSGFFDSVELQQKQTLSNPLKIDINPLPQTNLVCDGIGTFKSFTLSVDKTSALANEAISLNLELEGAGNFDQIATPKLQMPNFVKHYESKIDFTPNPTLGFFGGKKRFEYVIQVSNTGKITIPAQQFTYFDIEAKSYKTVQTNDITIQINQPLDEPQQKPFQNQQLEQKIDIKSKLKDISFIEEDASATKTDGWKIPLWLFIVLILSPIIFFFNFGNKLLVFILKNRVFKLFSKKAALSKFQTEFETLSKNNRPEKLYLFFLKILAEKFDVNTQLITTDFITNKLANLNWDVKKIGDFTDYMNECASLHFITTNRNINPDMTNILFKKGQYWIMLLTNKNL